MPQVNLEFDRDELYADVWSAPVSKLAVKLGFTSYAIAKAAKKLGVPLPPNGHWTPVAHGKPTSKPPLPEGKLPAEIPGRLEGSVRQRRASGQG